MLLRFRERTEVSRRAGELYGSVVAAARQPRFYESLGVPDTPVGRFELVALHLYLALDSLPPDTEALRQRLIETFVTDMDDCLREMAVGDLAVPKKVRRAAAVFFARSGVYQDAARRADDAALIETFIEHIFDVDDGRRPSAKALACYVRSARFALKTVAFDDWVAGSGPLRILADEATTQETSTT
jgi:cytochrome b pre-mRNA-processing protein 3